MMKEDPDLEEEFSNQPPAERSFAQKHSKTGFILLVILACCFIATAVPYFINTLGFGLPIETDPNSHGTCRVSDGFQVDCLPELDSSFEDGRAKCSERSCCWDDSAEIPCFQRLPSYSHSSKVLDIDTETMSGTLESPHLLDEETTLVSYSLTAGVEGEVIIEIGEKIEEARENSGGLEIFDITIGCPGADGVTAQTQCVDDIFTFELGPHNDRGETESYVRSQFGPLMVSDDLSEVSLYLPGPRVLSYGMDDLVWSGGRHVTRFNYNQESSLHLPVILSMHPNNEWSLIWLETLYPGEIVINDGSLSRPLATFRTMGGPLKLHLITAPDLETLLNTQREMMPTEKVPPLWTLGYHLCRRSENSINFQRDINGMTNAVPQLQFDTDCMNEELVKTAFNLNTAYTDEHFNLLKNNEKDLVLPLVPQWSYNDETGQAGGCLLRSDSDECEMGSLYGDKVMYPDLGLNSDWVARDLGMMLETISDQYNLSPVGWWPHAAQPLDEDADMKTKNCSEFPYTPRYSDLSHGLVCQRSRTGSDNTSLVTQHSQYSQKFSSILDKVADSPYQMRGEVSYGGGHLGGYQGSRVASTWAGLASSLREVLLLGLLGHGQVSMPVCGTHRADEDQPADMDDEDLGLLCLRWAQLAAFMPSMRSWYMDEDNSRMPYELAKQYQEYITWSLDTRYSLLPYLRSLQLSWASSGLPIVRPMLLAAPGLASASWEQFMLGPDLCVAAITQADQQLVQVSLPSGTWYDYYSGVSTFSSTEHAKLPVPTKLYQLPVFMRGGSAILMYQGLTGTSSMKDYVYGASNFELKIALECNARPRMLKTCEAKSSQDWVLDLDNSSPVASASVRVDTEVDIEGTITITMTSTVENKLSVVWVAGLSLTPGSSFLLPGDVTAPRCGEEAASEPCWTQQQGVVILRNANITLKSEEIKITWTVLQE